jgi:hypothetical protein
MSPISDHTVPLFCGDASNRPSHLLDPVHQQRLYDNHYQELPSFLSHRHEFSRNHPSLL